MATERHRACVTAIHRKLPTDRASCVRRSDTPKFSVDVTEARWCNGDSEFQLRDTNRAKCGWVAVCSGGLEFTARADSDVFEFDDGTQTHARQDRQIAR